LRIRQNHAVQPFHHVAKNGADGAAAGARLLFQLRLVAGFAGRADHDDLKLFIVIHARHIGIQHALIAQETKCEVFGVISDCHRGDDLLIVKVDRQRAFLDNAQINGRAVLIRASHSAGQARRVGVRRDQIT